MNAFPKLTVGAALFCALSLISGCETTDGGSAQPSSMYYGVGYSDPWYYGDYDDDVVVVRPPPDGDWGARPSHPIAEPPSSPGFGARPTPMPSAPRPSFRR